MVVSIKIRSERQSTCAFAPRRSLAKVARHSWTHPEGWRDWPFEAPATSRLRERCQFLTDVAEASVRPPPRRIPAEVFDSHGCHQADLSRVPSRVWARGQVRVRPLLRTA